MYVYMYMRVICVLSDMLSCKYVHIILCLGASVTKETIKHLYAQ